MVVFQAGEGFAGVFPRWNAIVTGIVPFLVFAVAGTAELNRPPFDLVEAEQELVGGFHTEYSSIRFALFFLAEFMNTITMSAVIVTLFFGGPAGPVLVESIGGVGIGWAWGVVWFFLKLFVFLFCFVWVRATLPRFRYDQLMDLGWKLLTPAALAWFLFLATLQTSREQNWNQAVVSTVAVAAMLLASALLRQARARGKTTRNPNPRILQKSRPRKSSSAVTTTLSSSYWSSMPLASTISTVSVNPPPRASKSTLPTSSAFNGGSTSAGSTPAARGYSNVSRLK